MLIKLVPLFYLPLFCLSSVYFLHRLLEYEPEGDSFERKVYEGAKGSLAPLQQFVNGAFPK